MHRDVIIRAIITEQSMSNASKSKFTFEVAKDTTKPMIKKAIQDAFLVHVVALTTSFVKGKKRRFGKQRTEIPLRVRKKATVTLKEGEKISLFDVGSEKK